MAKNSEAADSDRRRMYRVRLWDDGYATGCASQLSWTARLLIADIRRAGGTLDDLAARIEGAMHKRGVDGECPRCALRGCSQ